MINLSVKQLIILIIAIILIIIILYIYSNKSKCNQFENYSSSKTEAKIYYFYSPQCGYCKQFTNTWNELVNKNKDLEFISVDATVKENQNLAFYYNINKFPTIILVTPKKTSEYTGNRSYAEILNFVRSNL